MIVGTNSDEGTSFAPKGLNTTQEFREALLEDTTATFADQILAAYPLQSPENDLANLGPRDFVPPALPYGTQWRRTTTYYTDSTFEANRRLSCQTWTSNDLPAYCYRFNAIPSWAGPHDGATQFVEVVFAMKNLLGVGYPPVRSPPFEGLSEGYTELATLMSGHWVSFVVSGDPNAWERSGVVASLPDVVPAWEEYADAVFEYEGNHTVGMTADDWRQEGIDLIKTVATRKCMVGSERLELPYIYNHLYFFPFPSFPLVPSTLSLNPSTASPNLSLSVSSTTTFTFSTLIPSLLPISFPLTTSPTNHFASLCVNSVHASPPLPALAVRPTRCT